MHAKKALSQCRGIQDLKCFLESKQMQTVVHSWGGRRWVWIDPKSGQKSYLTFNSILKHLDKIARLSSRRTPELDAEELELMCLLQAQNKKADMLLRGSSRCVRVMTHVKKIIGRCFFNRNKVWGRYQAALQQSVSSASPTKLFLQATASPSAGIKSFTAKQKNIYTSLCAINRDQIRLFIQLVESCDRTKEGCFAALKAFEKENQAMPAQRLKLFKEQQSRYLHHLRSLYVEPDHIEQLRELLKALECDDLLFKYLVATLSTPNLITLDDLETLIVGEQAQRYMPLKPFFELMGVMRNSMNVKYVCFPPTINKPLRAEGAAFFDALLKMGDDQITIGLSSVAGDKVDLQSVCKLEVRRLEEIEKLPKDVKERFDLCEKKLDTELDALMAKSNCQEILHEVFNHLYFLSSERFLYLWVKFSLHPLIQQGMDFFTDNLAWPIDSNAFDFIEKTDLLKRVKLSSAGEKLLSSLLKMEDKRLDMILEPINNATVEAESLKTAQKETKIIESKQSKKDLVRWHEQEKQIDALIRKLLASPTSMNELQVVFIYLQHLSSSVFKFLFLVLSNYPNFMPSDEFEKKFKFPVDVDGSVFTKKVKMIKALSDEFQELFQQAQNNKLTAQKSALVEKEVQKYSRPIEQHQVPPVLDTSQETPPANISRKLKKPGVIIELIDDANEAQEVAKRQVQIDLYNLRMLELTKKLGMLDTEIQVYTSEIAGIDSELFKLDPMLFVESGADDRPLEPASEAVQEKVDALIAQRMEHETAMNASNEERESISLEMQGVLKIISDLQADAKAM